MWRTFLGSELILGIYSRNIRLFISLNNRYYKYIIKLIDIYSDKYRSQYGHMQNTSGSHFAKW